MQRIVNPRQTCLFDPYDAVLTDITRRRLLEDWPGVFRHVILELMPVRALRQHFHPDLGRPTRELYSMAGLILLMEFHNWTKAQAVEAYCFHLNVQYALNLEPLAHDLSVRTLERYLRYFEQEELAQRVMHEVTTRLVKVLGLRIDQQRLDSTHVFSDMAHFGRTRLLGVALKRFLTQVKRHDPPAYASLPEALRQRYAPSDLRLFADTARDQPSQHLLRQQVAEDLHQMLRLFADPSPHAQRSSYKAMERIFHEQCEVQEQKVVLKTHAGSAVMQNPSDPDATYDGHKGPGYQAQIAETCHPDNETQLITSVLPQTAAVTDEKALAPVLEDLQACQLLPEELLVDTLYPSDENVQQAERLGVELVGPVPLRRPGRAAGGFEVHPVLAYFDDSWGPAPNPPAFGALGQQHGRETTRCPYCPTAAVSGSRELHAYAMPGRRGTPSCSVPSVAETSARCRGLKDILDGGLFPGIDTGCLDVSIMLLAQSAKCRGSGGRAPGDWVLLNLEVRKNRMSRI